LSFNDFIFHLAPLALILMIVFVGLCRVMFGSAFTYDAERVAAVMAMREREAITDRRLLNQSLVVLTAVMVGFVAHSALHIEPSMVALLGAGVLVAVSRLQPAKYTEEVEWQTLVFFMGLFIMVGALIEVGAMERLGQTLTDAVGEKYFLTSSLLLGGSAVLSGIVDNIPYVATVSPLVSDLVAGGTDPARTGMWWALAAGADLGGNATAVGASANVVIIGIAARHGYPISFWKFTRYGLVVAAVTVTIAWGYLWLRYYA
jgi:Na+/H+ antiporter NhaD/arsenite permease-like protein